MNAGYLVKDKKINQEHVSRFTNPGKSLQSMISKKYKNIPGKSPGNFPKPPLIGCWVFSKRKRRLAEAEIRWRWLSI